MSDSSLHARCETSCKLCRRCAAATNFSAATEVECREGRGRRRGVCEINTVHSQSASVVIIFITFNLRLWASQPVEHVPFPSPSLFLTRPFLVYRCNFFRLTKFISTTFLLIFTLFFCNVTTNLLWQIIAVKITDCFWVIYTFLLLLPLLLLLLQTVALCLMGGKKRKKDSLHLHM